MFPDKIKVTFKREDWRTARVAVRANPGNLVETCALAQTFIREINDGATFQVGTYQVDILKDGNDLVYEHDGADIVKAFDDKRRIPPDTVVTLKRHKGDEGQF